MKYKKNSLMPFFVGALFCVALGFAKNDQLRKILMMLFIGLFIAYVAREV